MLQPYIKKLSQLLKLDDPSRSEKDRKAGLLLVQSRILYEVEQFILNNLLEEDKEYFQKRLEEAEGIDPSGDKEMHIILRYLMRIPHARYRLDAHMQDVIASVAYQLLKKGESHQIADNAHVS